MSSSELVARVKAEPDLAQSPSCLLDSPPPSVSTARTHTRRPDPSDEPAECLLGVLQVSLPCGTVLSSEPPSALLDEYVRPGQNLLAALDGKGAQILTMQAFCGNSKPRMFARLKSGSRTLPCTFVCEFSADARQPTARQARIHVYSIQFASAAPASPRAEFITRHNTNCSLIYFDALSVPFLGHFPSERTGSSLFSIVHPDDFGVLERVHRELRAGAALARSARLRLLTYEGRVCRVDSEWAAFTNPWSGHVEMVVARHRVLGMAGAPGLAQPAGAALCRSFDQRIRAILENAYPFAAKTELVAPSGVASPPLTRCSGSPPRSPDLTLSYHQINCLENVHRLLKSQCTAAEAHCTQLQCAAAAAGRQNARSAPPLTRELLHQHDRRWEAACKGSWNRRLLMKRARSAADDDQQPAAKAARGRSSPVRAEDAAPAHKTRPEPAARPPLQPRLQPRQQLQQQQLLQYLNLLLLHPQLQRALGQTPAWPTAPPPQPLAPTRF